MLMRHKSDGKKEKEKKQQREEIRLTQQNNLEGNDELRSVIGREQSM